MDKINRCMKQGYFTEQDLHTYYTYVNPAYMCICPICKIDMCIENGNFTKEELLKYIEEMDKENDE